MYNELKLKLFIFTFTAEQYASAFHTLAAAINLRKDNPEIYMLLGSMCIFILWKYDIVYLMLIKVSLI